MSWETQTGADATHDLCDDTVQILERRVLDLEGPLGHVVESLVIKTHGHVAVLDDLVDGEHCIVRLTKVENRPGQPAIRLSYLNNGLGHLRFGE